MQDKIDNQTTVKLEAYVSMNVYNDMQGDFKVHERRLTKVEDDLKATDHKCQENEEKIENSRKRIQRLVSDLAVLKRSTDSQLEQVRANSSQGHDNLTVEQLGNIEVSEEGMQRMTNMVKVLEGNLTRRIAAVEDSFGKIAELEEMIEQVKADGVKPSQVQDLGFTPEDIAKWNDNLKKAEELDERIKQVQIDVTILDGAKIKSDISNLTKAQQTFMTKDAVSNLMADVKKIRNEIADNSYEVQNAKDSVSKVEKLIDANHKELKEKLGEARKKADNNEGNVNGIKKSIQALDDRLKAFIKNAQLSGNTAVGEGNIVQEIEDNIQKLQGDLEDLKKK